MKAAPPVGEEQVESVASEKKIISKSRRKSNMDPDSKADRVYVKPMTSKLDDPRQKNMGREFSPVKDGVL